MTNSEEQIETELTRVRKSGTLGRSRVYARLLRYLADAAARGEPPKEIDIATDVLGKTDFDPTNDSSVRVYIHHLRQKLEAYYAEQPAPGPQLCIPKGKYQLVLTEADGLPTAAPALRPGTAALHSRWWLAGGFAIVLLLAAWYLGRLTAPAEVAAGPGLAQAPAWQAILDDRLPVVIVVGDYFMFAEHGPEHPGQRLIRNFDINDSDDFDAWIAASPELQDQYTDINLSYLPVGIAPALADVIRVLPVSSRPVRLIPQSQFRAPMLRLSHVVYIGLISGLGDLGQYAFSASRLAVGTSYDQLIDIETGDDYVSSAGIVTDSTTNYVDYGFVSTFPGPSDNQFLIIAGMRDEGLMRMASIATDAKEAQALGKSLAAAGKAPAFEALYRVSGVDRTHIAATQVMITPLDAEWIWNQPN